MTKSCWMKDKGFYWIMTLIYYFEVDEEECTKSSSRPMSQIQCSPDDCDTWDIGPWSPCSTSCGIGVQSRKVVCRQLAGTIGSRYHLLMQLSSSFKWRLIEFSWHWYLLLWLKSFTSMFGTENISEYKFILGYCYKIHEFPQTHLS